MKHTDSDGNPSSPRSDGLVRMLVVACLAFAALDVFLAIQNRELTVRVEAYSRATAGAERPPRRPLLGERLPSGPLLDPTGAAFEFTAPTTVLFVSSPSCDLCQRAAPHWRRAYESLTSIEVPALGLVLEASANELDPGHSPFPLLIPKDHGAQLFRDLEGVPATVFVDANGVVERILYGDNQLGLDDAVRELSLRAPAD